MGAASLSATFTAAYSIGELVDAGLVLSGAVSSDCVV